MARRGRPRKRGNARMDAALDFTCPMGYPTTVVRQTVKELLQVYGGKEYWTLIEMDCYKALLDALFAKEETGSPKKLVSQGDTRGLIDTELSIAGSSCGVTTPNCFELEVLNTNMPSDAALNSVSQSTEVLDFDWQTNEAGAKDYNSLPTEEERRGDLKYYKSEMNSSTKNVDVCVKEWENDKHLAKTICTPKLEGILSSWKRRRYHGWISGDDNNEDLMDLVPISLPEGWEKLFRQIHGKKKRSIRWDVRPEDVLGSHLLC